MNVLKKERYDGFFGGLYKRNETFLMISATMLIVSMVIGYAFADLLSPILGMIFGDFQNRVVQGEIQLTTLSIFSNNIHVALSIYLGGLVLGTLSSIYLIMNGLFIGY